jgi:hypothetical protein
MSSTFSTPWRRMPSSATLILGWVLVRNPALIDLNFALATLIGIVERGKKLTCTQEGYKAKLTHRDQKATL